MLNIEKYKGEIIDVLEHCAFPSYFSNLKIALVDIYKESINDNELDRRDVEDIELINWLCEEYQEPILNDEEKKYLSAFVKPFRNVIGCVNKQNDGVHFCTIEGDFIFPYFLNEMMFKDMEENKDYSLEELGL